MWWCLALLRLLMGLLVVAYIGINFVADLPAFLIIENLFYAATYATGLLFAGRPHVLDAVALIAAFNAGRVSRSVITPEGKLFNDQPPVVASHAALAALVFLVAVLSLACRGR